MKRCARFDVRSLVFGRRYHRYFLYKCGTCGKRAAAATVTECVIYICSRPEAATMNRRRCRHQCVGSESISMGACTQIAIHTYYSHHANTHGNFHRGACGYTSTDTQKVLQIHWWGGGGRERGERERETEWRRRGWLLRMTIIGSTLIHTRNRIISEFRAATIHSACVYLQIYRVSSLSLSLSVITLFIVDTVGSFCISMIVVIFFKLSRSVSYLSRYRYVDK